MKEMYMDFKQNTISANTAKLLLKRAHIYRSICLTFHGIISVVEKILKKEQTNSKQMHLYVSTYTCKDKVSDN